MARKANTPDAPKPNPQLTTTRADAEGRIKVRIDQGRGLLKRDVNTEEDVEELRNDYYKWDSFNTEMLTRMFTTDSIANEYSWWGVVAVSRSHSIREIYEGVAKDVKDKIHRLDSICERLELIPVAATAVRTVPHRGGETAGRRIFIVHGHDEQAKEATARLVERLGLEAVILHEQASGGRSILAKLEHYGEVAFAVVLLTPDDLGSKAGAEELRPRARQNVVLELGYFLGRLGTARVCALHKGELELPGDFDGVVYVAMDANGAWKFQLAKELRAAGFKVDLNVV